MKKMTGIPQVFDEPIFRRVFQLAEISNLNMDEAMLYRSSLQDKLEYDRSLAWAKEKATKQGLDQGLEHGLDQGKIDIIENLIRKNDLSDESNASMIGGDHTHILK